MSSIDLSKSRRTTSNLSQNIRYQSQISLNFHLPRAHSNPARRLAFPLRSRNVYFPRGINILDELGVFLLVSRSKYHNNMGVLKLFFFRTRWQQLIVIT